MSTVPSWKAIEDSEPDFAGRVRRLFDAGRHKTIALNAEGTKLVVESWTPASGLRKLERD